MKYYIGVAVRKSGHATVTIPTTSEQECIEMLKAVVTKRFDKIAFTTYITRTSDEPITLADVFGNPRSRDLMQDKKFLKEITNG